jgi:hypothetical protein
MREDGLDGYHIHERCPSVSGMAQNAVARHMQGDWKTEVTTMALWNVSHANGKVRFGSFTRKATTPSGCNEPFKNAFWCPKRKWFAAQPCPFSSKYECMSFARFSGSL